MNEWLKKRVSEGSTWAGLAAIVAGVGTIGKVNETPHIVDAIGQVGQVVATGGFNWPSIAMIAMGALAAILKDKGAR